MNQFLKEQKMTKLEFIRKIKRDLSRTDLADISTVPISRITRAEKDLIELSLSDWMALAKALGVSAKALYVKQGENGLCPRERSSDYPCLC